MNIQTKIHDKFSIEFKMGFTNRESADTNNFAVNVWIFTPNNLDINANTFDKNRFYQSVKSNIRLITPNFSLSDLANNNSLPWQNLHSALSNAPSKEKKINYLFHIKMFAAIFKNAIRHEVDDIQLISETEEKKKRLEKLHTNLQTILYQYRNIQRHFAEKNQDIASVLQFGDEYMSHIVDVQISRAIFQNQQAVPTSTQKLSTFLIQERKYKSECKYSHISTENPTQNSLLISRHSLLKKYIESALYLKVNKTPDNLILQQISLSTAAGIALIVSTLISLPFEKFLSHYPIIIFAIVVLAYMCKDIVKELMRKRFSKRIRGRFYDNKNILNFKGEEIGCIKEVFNHISDEKVPTEVLAIRNRSELEIDNNSLEERTLLYRKQVEIKTSSLHHKFSYKYSGIYDIIRIHFQDFTHKMDDPIVELQTIDEQGNKVSIQTLRTYTFHIVLQYVQEEKSDYCGYQILATRDGILSCKKLPIL